VSDEWLIEKVTKIFDAAEKLPPETWLWHFEDRAPNAKPWIAVEPKGKGLRSPGCVDLWRHCDGDIYAIMHEPGPNRSTLEHNEMLKGDLKTRAEGLMQRAREHVDEKFEAKLRGLLSFHDNVDPKRAKRIRRAAQLRI
jgi:hypothetical protein